MNVTGRGLLCASVLCHRVCPSIAGLKAALLRSLFARCAPSRAVFGD